MENTPIPPSGTPPAPPSNPAPASAPKTLGIKVDPAFISKYRPLLLLGAIAVAVALLAVLKFLFHIPPNFGFANILKSIVSTFCISLLQVYLPVAAFLKLLDIKGFAERFKQYDIISESIHSYASVFPWIEIGAFALLSSSEANFGASHWSRPIATIVLMVIGGMGVLSVLRAEKQGKHLTCATLGSGVNLPLDKIALIEYATVGVCGLLLLFFPPPSILEVIQQQIQHLLSH